MTAILFWPQTGVATYNTSAGWEDLTYEFVKYYLVHGIYIFVICEKLTLYMLTALKKTSVSIYLFHVID